jgi:hypothetical protein
MEIKMNKIKKICTLSFATLLLLGLMLFVIPVANVHAQSPADEPLPPVIEPLPDDSLPVTGDNGEVKDIVLERLFKRAQAAHENQQKLIAQADKLGNRIAELIVRAKSNGKDTTSLEAALADFNMKIGEARLKFDQTGKLIRQHTGFDDAGKVTDSAVAKTTLEEIRNGNKDVRQTLVEALKVLREAGRAFREANPKPEPVSNPA